MPFQIIRNDITKVKADAIVNTANPQPIYGGGVDSAVYHAAGAAELLAEREKIGVIPRGQAVYTPAFKLNAKYIIHTVAPVWIDGEHGEFDTLKACYENSLALARQLKCKSVAFPLIAAGVYRFPKDKALQVAMSVIQPFVMEHRIMVTLVVFDDKAFQLSGNVVENVRQYVDSNYVAAAEEREYRFNSLRRRRLAEREAYNNLSDKERPSAVMPKDAVQSPVDIDSLLASSQKTFQEKLFEIIDARGLTGPQVYKNYITKQVFSKIQSDKNYHPNKYTAIALCLSLHLSVDETQDLIGRAGWTLSPSNMADLVVKGCIMNKEYNVVNIDMILFDYHCPQLSSIK